MPKQVGVQTNIQVGVQTNIKAGVTGSVGVYTPTAPTPTPSPSNPSAIVSGAGTAAANGVYTYRGLNDGKPYYNKLGDPDEPLNGIRWVSQVLAWFIADVGGDLYLSTDDVAFPWLATFDVQDGDPPAPTVTHS
jgi:hypothetical protein